MKVLGSSGKLSPKFKLYLKRGITLAVIGGLIFVGTTQARKEQEQIQQAEERSRQIKEHNRRQAVAVSKARAAEKKAKFDKGFKAYRAKVLALDVEGDFIRDVYRPWPDTPAIYVEMTNLYTYQPKIDRLQLAQDLHKIWLVQGNESATAFYLVDRNRNHLTDMSWGRVTIKD